MTFRLLPGILEQASSDFHRVDRRWEPKQLFGTLFRQQLLTDAQERYNTLQEAESELALLERGPLYIRILSRMRISIRQAQFAWRHDDLALIKAISEFLSDYGTVLQNLKIDQARGRFDEPSTQLGV